MEEDVLKIWGQEDVFKKTLEKPAPQGDFVFYEGPPTANGMPGIHHVEARAFKDIIPRYKTMRGFRVPRQAGWDTHGLPVELEVEKRLGISGKPQIESLKKTPEESIAYFNEECKKSVWNYLDAWIKMTRRIGFWLDLDHPYITYETGYIAKLWGIIKKINDRGLLYKDYKVIPFCSRCGTALSSHELAQGYDEAEDPSIYVKFKLRQRFHELNHETTYFLVWTTTPWTLPGNVALAVKKDADYVAITLRQDQGDTLILAKARLSVLNDEYEILREFKGRDLVGLDYEPLYNFVAYDKKAHYVTSADFVSLDDGTGIVHTAVMYGADDFELGEKIGLPKKHVVGPDGKFLPEVKPWAEKFVKDADPDIINDLKERGLLYRHETIKHTYPFCWRCDTPLLYYARNSWFIRMSKLRDELIKENQKINWMPEHIRDGRFGEWLREVKDWAFSRERYWGTPLPVWVCDACQTQKVVGGLDEFPTSPSCNTYFILRHGERDDHGRLVSSNMKAPIKLTEHGRKQIEDAAKKIKKEKVDVILSSDYIRTKETAEIVSREIGVKVAYDERLCEIQLGEWDGLTVTDYNKHFNDRLDHFTKASPGGETLTDVTRRMMAVVHDLEKKYRGKKILLVSHGDPLWMLEGAYRGMTAREMIAWDAAGNYIKMGELRKLPPLQLLPRNADGFVDLHRPYIDTVTFPCPKCGKTMTRTKEVCDVWFDSGSMPFASDAPGYPADYISEAIDQTRGWFYTLLAVATLIEKKAPYKNVICLGHLLDIKGQKMSKSRGNVVDPVAMIEKYGADAVRWYMYTVNQPGDAKRFDEKDLDQIVKKVFLILWNVLTFWKTYSVTLSPTKGDTKHVLDRWIKARLSELVASVTDDLDHYHVTEAGRAIAYFITDLSTWYVRRSRERMKTGDGVAVLRHVLDVLARLMAPFTPFLADSLWRELGHKTSVHLTDWPAPSVIARSETTKQSSILSDMDLIRRIASLVHEQRAAAKIPVRQPLATLTVHGSNLSSPTSDRGSHGDSRSARGYDSNELIEVLKEEINVRDVRFVKGDVLSVELDCTLTPELRREGLLREIVRAVNDLRKQAKLTVADRIVLCYATDDPATRDVFTSSANTLAAAARADRIESGKKKSDAETELPNLWLGITKL